MRPATPLHRLRLIALTLILALALALAACSKKPEATLAKHLDAIAEIMEKHADKPADGVDKLRAYLHDNLPEMAEQIGKMIVELEKINTEDAMKKRAEEYQAAIKPSIEKLQKQSIPFGGKVMSDEKASKKIAEIQANWQPVAENLAGVLMMIGLAGAGGPGGGFDLD
jgi:ElaB/YqjD/DUF883 family membrane-anchored ribosome-binding protein